MFLFSGATRLGFALLFVAATVPAFAAGSATIEIKNIGNGQKVTSARIPLKVSVSNFDVECRDAGKPGTHGRGHIHAMLDGMDMAHLTNFYCSNSFEISGAGLKPGKHTLAVALADDAHMMAGKPAMTTFDYEPAAEVALPKPVTAANPSLRILSPAPGSPVGRKFDLVVAVSDFNLSCDLEGKPDVKGYGHLHVFVTQRGVTDKMSAMEKPTAAAMGSKPMMSMVGMVAMPCTKTVPIDLSTWRTGKANVMVMLANNDHMPVMGAAGASVAVTIK